jgi:hypothetical protein
VPKGYWPHPLRQTWSNMIHRCFSPVNTRYKDYGGRGITVCEEWRGPEGFLRYIAFVDYVLGPKPSDGYTLDRIYNNGNYEPGNLRWADWHTQRVNQRFAQAPRIYGKTWMNEHLSPE